MIEAALREHKDIVSSQTRETLPLPITGLILCGGKSKRMGRPKAFLPFHGLTIVEHLFHTFTELFDEVFLVAEEPESFSDLSVDVVKDILPNRGPICGILSGLLVAKNDYAFVTACDMPLVDKKLIRQMTMTRHGNDVVALKHGAEIEPLLALYSKSCIKSLEDCLFAGKSAVHEVLSGVQATTFEYEETASQYLPPYFNVNTPRDYSELLDKVSPVIRG